jgi:hypothetical protein
VLGQPYAERFGVEQLEELRLLGVLGAGRITEGGTDAPILLPDQVLLGEGLGLAVTPIASRPFVQASRSASALTMIAL